MRMPTDEELSLRSLVNFPPTGLPLDFPAIEELPEFMGRVDVSSLHPCCRAFNPSICAFMGGRFMAYRSEAVNAINSVRLARLSADLAVTADMSVQLPPESGVQYEDPRLTEVAGKLHLMVVHVKFGMPNICKQRLFVIEPDGSVECEIPLPFGMEGKPEKNWLPFELPGGDLGIVYTQKPHHVIEVTRAIGHMSPGLLDFKLGRMLSGRTPPLRVYGSTYLSFFGGHVKHSYRGARYFVGAQLFSAKPPYEIMAATPTPISWPSECAPNLFSDRQSSGHPICIFPGGIIKEGDNLIVSCGVNDSYIVFLRYSLSALLRGMKAVDGDGHFRELGVQS